MLISLRDPLISRKISVRNISFSNVVCFGIEPDVIEGGAGAKNSVRKDEILVPRWSEEYAARTGERDI